MNENIKIILRKWVKIEEEINILENKLKKLKEKKEVINPILEDYLKEKKKIKINNKNTLNYIEKDFYKELNKEFLSKTLSEIIDEKEKVEKIINYIYKNRDIFTTKLLLIK